MANSAIEMLTFTSQAFYSAQIRNFITTIIRNSFPNFFHENFAPPLKGSIYNLVYGHLKF